MMILLGILIVVMGLSAVFALFLAISIILEMRKWK